MDRPPPAEQPPGLGVVLHLKNVHVEEVDNKHKTTQGWVKEQSAAVPMLCSGLLLRSEQERSDEDAGADEE